MYPIKSIIIKVDNHLPPRFSCLLALGYSVLNLGSVLLPFIRQKSIMTLSYFMAAYICQIYYLRVANEETESSCMVCWGLYLKSGSLTHFVACDETVRLLYLSLGKCMEMMFWSRINRSFAVDVSGSEFLSCCLDFLPPCLSLKDFYVDWQGGYMHTHKFIGIKSSC